MSYDFDFSFLAETWPSFVSGTWLTIQMTALSISAGLLLGAAGAVLRVFGHPAVRHLVGAYVEVIRNTPLLVQIFIFYFGIASLGFRLSAEASAVIALVINMGAYATEIIRAGIASIPRTQLEAGDCLGLTSWQTIRHVVLLPAVERVYPALTSQSVLLMLASSITSQISAEELTGVASGVQSETFRSFEVYIVVAVIYVVLSFAYRLAFWGMGLALFARRRRLGAVG